MNFSWLRAARFFSAVCLLLLVATYASAQSASPATETADEADSAGDVVLNCQVANRIPSTAAEISEGGFTFAYQSVAGVLADGRSCAVYRLRNLPGQPPTPVRWRAGDEILVEAARLARCSDDPSCHWFEIARYFEGAVLVGKTELSFGLNADSFHHEDRGLIASADPAIGAARASVGSELVAQLTLADGSLLNLHVLVKSYFKRSRAGLVLVYDVLSDDPALLDGSQVRFEWDAFASAPPVLARLLERDDSAPFILPVGRVPTAQLAGEPLLERRPGAVVLTVPVEQFVYLGNLSLRVVDSSDPTTPLLTITMPAFVPGIEP